MNETTQKQNKKKVGRPAKYKKVTLNPEKPWGSSRPGAGRPRVTGNSDPRGKHSIYCTAGELVVIRKALAAIRASQLDVAIGDLITNAAHDISHANCDRPQDVPDCP